jgi:hypothetical protein
MNQFSLSSVSSVPNSMMDQNQERSNRFNQRSYTSPTLSTSQLYSSQSSQPMMMSPSPSPSMSMPSMSSPAPMMPSTSSVMTAPPVVTPSVVIAPSVMASTLSVTSPSSSSPIVYAPSSMMSSYSSQPSSLSQITSIFERFWNDLTTSHIQPIAYLYMIVLLIIGILVGSLNRMTSCRMPGGKCNFYIIAIAGALICLLSYLSVIHEHDDPNRTVTNSWQYYAMALSIVGIVAYYFASKKANPYSNPYGVGSPMY